VSRWPAAARRALVDTSAYYALADRTDTHHDSARAVVALLVAEHWRLFTTNYIVAETHALFLARLGKVEAISFLDAIDRSATAIVRVTAGDER
jgi:predicted nucleic acid-binding protein